MWKTILGFFLLFSVLIGPVFLVIIIFASTLQGHDSPQVGNSTIFLGLFITLILYRVVFWPIAKAILEGLHVRWEKNKYKEENY